MKKEENRITIGVLKEILNSYPDDRELYFGGLEFCRLKDRGGHVQVEFTEAAYRDDNGKVIMTFRIFLPNFQSKLFGRR